MVEWNNFRGERESRNDWLRELGCTLSYQAYYQLAWLNSLNYACDDPVEVVKEEEIFMNVFDAWHA